MTRLIDADALFINLDGMMAVSPTGYIHGDTVADMINDAPTIDAVPVKHGKWILEQERFVYGIGNCWWNRWSCSCCGYVRTKGWAVTVEGHKPKAMLCENCGARMDEE